MTTLTPYLLFDGNTAEALEFYKTTLGGEIPMIQKFSEGPMDVPPEAADKIMHAEYHCCGNLLFMASDGMPGSPVIDGNRVSLSLTMDDDEHLQSTFDALAEGGQIQMPLAEAFWGAKFGMLTDKFGIIWMLSLKMPE